MELIKVLKNGFGFTKSDKYFKFERCIEESLKFMLQNNIPCYISSGKQIYLEDVEIKTNIGIFISGNFDQDDIQYLEGVTAFARRNIIEKLDKPEIEIESIRLLSSEEKESYKNLAYKAKSEKSSRDFRRWSSKWHCVNNYHYYFGRDSLMEKTIYEDIDDLENNNYQTRFLYRGVEASSEKELAEMFNVKKYGCVNHNHMDDIADSYDLLSD